MSVGSSLLGFMGRQDPRQRLVDSILRAQQPVASAPYAAQQDPAAATQVATTEPEGGVYATQAGRDNPIVHQPEQPVQPPTQAEAYTSPDDLSGMYKELLEYNSRVQNVDRGFALLGSAFAHPENRANIINTFTGGTDTGTIAPDKMVELVQNIQKANAEKAQMAAQMAALPGIAAKLGIDLPTAQLLLQNGQLDDVIAERDKEMPQLVTDAATGENIGIDRRGGKESFRIGGKRPVELKFEKIGDDLHILNPDGTDNRIIKNDDPDYMEVKDANGQTHLIDKKTQSIVKSFGTVVDPNATDDTKEYDRYRKDLPAGTPPMSFEDWQTKMKKAGANQTSVTLAGEKKFDEEMGKLEAEEYAEWQKKAQAARDLKGKYEMVEKALDAGLETGTGANVALAGRKVGSAIDSLTGLKIFDPDMSKVAAAETVAAAQNELAMMKRNPDSGLGLPGSVSDRDLQFLKDADIQLGTSVEGNRTLIKMARAVANRNEVVAQMAADHIRKHKRLGPEWAAELKAYADSHPLFEGIEIRQMTPEQKRAEKMKEYGLDGN